MTEHDERARRIMLENGWLEDDDELDGLASFENLAAEFAEVEREAVLHSPLYVTLRRQRDKVVGLLREARKELRIEHGLRGAGGAHDTDNCSACQTMLRIDAALKEVGDESSGMV